MTMNRSRPSDWTSSLGNGGAIGTGQRAGGGADPSMGGSAITEARDTFQGTRERLEGGTGQASDNLTHAVDGTGYAGTNEDVGQLIDHESGQFSGLTNAQYAHDANPGGHKGGDVASVELMRDVGYASGGGLASPMGAAITSLMRNPAGEIKQPTTLSTTVSKENDGELGRTTMSKLKKGVELLPTKQSKSKEKDTKTQKVQRYAQNTNFGQDKAGIRNNCSGLCIWRLSLVMAGWCSTVPLLGRPAELGEMLM